MVKQYSSPEQFISELQGIICHVRSVVSEHVRFVWIFGRSLLQRAWGNASERLKLVIFHIMHHFSGMCGRL